MAELEAIHFLEPAVVGDRYVKVRAGVWRIRCRRAGAETNAEPPTAGPGRPLGTPPLPFANTNVNPKNSDHGVERDLLEAFYRAWTPNAPARRTDRDGARPARAVIARHGAAEALALVDRAAALVRSNFPQAKTFGAAVGYFDEAAREVEERRRRALSEAADTRRRLDERADEARRRAADEAFFDTWQPRWDALAPPAREAIVAVVLTAHPYLSRPALRTSRVAVQLYLEEFARQSSASERKDKVFADESENE